MVRIFFGITAIITGLIAGFFTFVDQSVDWVKRLESNETYTSISTTTLTFPEVAQVDALPQKERAVTSGQVSTTSVQFEERKEETATPPIRTEQKKPSPPVIKKAPPILAPTTSPIPSTIGKINEKTIMDLTNVERVREGSSVLVWNTKLAAMAYTKAKDMLDREYFAHESPDGKNVGGLAQDVGYVYRLVGENLALGNFRSNEELIQGWMNSPGHRENMLKSEYTEIGTAAIEGIYEGDKVWMAVQQFGKPLPLCVKPDPEQKVALVSTDSKLAALDGSIRIARSAIETAPDESVRGQKIDDYNMLIELYNTLVGQSKTLVNTYNESVRTYNTCIEG